MEPRTVLLTGGAGVLGTWLRRTAPADVEVVAVVHRSPVPVEHVVELDLRDSGAVTAAVEREQPELVIHVAYATDEASIVDATAHLASATAAVGGRLVFTSTDAVFAGDGVARSEGAPPDPATDYGRLKAAAEDAVRDASATGTVVRLPLVISLDPADAAVARVRKTADRGEVSWWFDDEIRQPAAAGELARAIWAIAALDPSAGAGTWHLPGAERISRFEIARRVAAALDLPMACVEGEPTPGDLVRPRDLHLRADRARAELGWAPSPILGGPASGRAVRGATGPEGSRHASRRAVAGP